MWLQGNGLHFDRVTEADTGIYTCYLDNFVQPVVSYKFSLMVEGKVNCLTVDENSNDMINCVPDPW